MRQGVPVTEIIADEKKEVEERFPHLLNMYNGLTRVQYSKIIRNRISALKSRIKKKSEEGELRMLREMVRRLYLMKN